MNKKNLRKIRSFKPKFRWFMVRDNIKGIINEIKGSHQRAVYGISKMDCWDLDSYLLDVLENGLTILERDTIGRPHKLSFEQWKDVLKYMRGLIAEIRIDGIDCEKSKAIWDRWHNEDLLPDEEWEEHIDEWIEATDDWEKHRQECLDMLCDLMKEYFFNLWW